MEEVRSFCLSFVSCIANSAAHASVLLSNMWSQAKRPMPDTQAMPNEPWVSFKDIMLQERTPCGYQVHVPGRTCRRPPNGALQEKRTSPER